MIKNIYIRNIVLINEININLSNGLHVFTGETGAGKSILLEGLGLALGARANFNLVGHQDSYAEVIAEFLIDDNSSIIKKLDKNNIKFNNQLFLKRIISKNGISKAYVNEVQVTLGDLNEIGRSLVEVQGQFENHTLLNSKNHTFFLDQFGNYTDTIKSTENLYRAMIEAKDEFYDFKNNFEQYEKNIEIKESILSDLEKINPKENEENELVARRGLIADSSKLIKVLGEALDNINSEHSIINLINYTLSSLEKINNQNNNELEEIINTLSRASNEINEAELQISNLVNSINADPNELDYIDNRLFVLRSFAKNVQCEPNNLFQFHKDTIETLKKVENRETALYEKEENYKHKLEAFKKGSLKLRELRINAAIKLDKSINFELPFLKLDEAEFKTFIKEKNENDWNINGSDEIIFNIITNPKQDFMPLGKIVSGGELSRFLLAIKVVLADPTRSSTLVFDEVDSGIGGQTADAVGSRLLKLSENNQVIVITHSPQVASKGNNHYLIEKLTTNDQSITMCRKISNNKRVEEISRMISGEKISNEARAAAIQLIDE